MALRGLSHLQTVLNTYSVSHNTTCCLLVCSEWPPNPIFTIPTPISSWMVHVHVKLHLSLSRGLPLSIQCFQSIRTAHPHSVCTRSTLSVLALLGLYLFYSVCICSVCTRSPRPVLALLSLYSLSSACTRSTRPVLALLSLYSLYSACTRSTQPVLALLGLYSLYSACTRSTQPVLALLGLYSLYSACTRSPRPVLALLGLYSLYSVCTCSTHFYLSACPSPACYFHASRFSMRVAMRVLRCRN